MRVAVYSNILIMEAIVFKLAFVVTVKEAEFLTRALNFVQKHSTFSLTKSAGSINSCTYNNHIYRNDWRRFVMRELTSFVKLRKKSAIAVFLATHTLLLPLLEKPS